MKYEQMKQLLDSLGVEYEEKWDDQINAPYLRLKPGMKKVLSHKDNLVLEICFDSDENFLDIVLWDWEELERKAMKDYSN